MYSNSADPTKIINWATFQQLLPEYVQKEIDGQDADVAYPQLALLVETSPEHEEAYHLEYRKQVMAMSAEELNALGQAPAPWDASIVAFTAPEALDAVDSIYPKVVDSITLWIERGVEICRGLEFDMPKLSGESTMAAAGAGMMGDEHSESAPKKESVHVSPAGAPLELTIDAKECPQKELCVLEIAVELEGRFGDYSGVTIMLEWGEQFREAVTDVLGHARFSDLPRTQLPQMRVRVILPDDE